MSEADRYFVNPLDDSAAFAEWRRTVERKLEGFAGAPQVGAQSTITDPLGRTLVSLGVLPDGSRGLLVVSAENNWDLVKLTDAGWIKPHLVGGPYDPANVKNVISGTFAAQFGVTFGEALGPGIEIMVPWQTAASTTGEVEVVWQGGTSAIKSVAANSSGYAFLRLLHGVAIGAGPLDFRIHARRASGAGAVTISPCHAWVQDPALCSSSGTWV